ncbi:MAG: hypothetical protein FWD52_04685 [Candidatus Bathyarchaeota archaeon]|nr:hypothetical protein [Candidatus Termiticorpusculum sp.]
MSFHVCTDKFCPSRREVDGVSICCWGNICEFQGERVELMLRPKQAVDGALLFSGFCVQGCPLALEFKCENCGRVDETVYTRYLHGCNRLEAKFCSTCYLDESKHKAYAERVRKRE